MESRVYGSDSEQSNRTLDVSVPKLNEEETGLGLLTYLTPSSVSFKLTFDT